jgi:hypothetical protein
MKSGTKIAICAECREKEDVWPELIERADPGRRETCAVVVKFVSVVSFSILLHLGGL